MDCQPSDPGSIPGFDSTFFLSILQALIYFNLLHFLEIIEMFDFIDYIVVKSIEKTWKINKTKY